MISLQPTLERKIFRTPDEFEKAIEALNVKQKENEKN
jgi:hypothetical protein